MPWPRRRCSAASRRCSRGATTRGWLPASRSGGTCTGVHGLRVGPRRRAGPGHPHERPDPAQPPCVDGPRDQRAHLLPVRPARRRTGARGSCSPRPLAVRPISTTAARPRPATGSRRLRVPARELRGPATHAPSPEESLLLLAHAVEALDWQRQLMRIQHALSASDPHPQTYSAAWRHAKRPDRAATAAPGGPGLERSRPC